MCQAVSTPYRGVVKVFEDKQLVKLVRNYEMAKEEVKKNKQAVSVLKPGEIVHYVDGADRFIRCKVVLDKDEIKIQPIALVGD